MKLLLVDGYSLLYRAFFSSPPLTTREGQPTGALYGFIRMVLRLIDENKPDSVLVAIDASGPTFRHDKAADYKANRAEMPSDLRSQTHLLGSLLDGLSIPHYEHIGYEADDILGTLSTMGAKEGMEVTIVTGDGDALQLVNEHVSVLLTRRGVSELDCYTPEAVKERFQFLPPLLPDYKGLRGDTSDNIPGVPGIGEKTGINLISNFGTLESLYERLDEVTPPRIRNLLEEHREKAFHSRELARIVCDLPIEIDLEACRYLLDDERRAMALETVRTYEFKSLYARYGTAGAAGPATNGPEVAAATAERDFSVKPVETAAEVLREMKSLDTKENPIALWNEGEVTALAHGDQVLLFRGDIVELKEFLESAKQPKTIHDAKPLQVALARRGVHLRGVVADTLLMGYLLDPARQQHSPALLAEKYLGRTLPTATIEPPKAAKKAKKTAKAPASLFDDAEAGEPEVDAEELAAERELAAQRQAEQDNVLAATAVALFDLQPVLRQELEEIKTLQLFETMELPLIEVLAEMELNGMLLDLERLRATGKELEAEAARLQGEIWELAGEEFNIGSTKQLQTILYEKMGLAKGRSIKTGFSTDVHTLEKLAEDHEVVRKILEYRATTKLKSTYIDGLLNCIDPETHRVHSNLNQTGAVSGRLSSTNPNLQNVPIRTAQGRMIRKAFIAPPGHVLLAVDYSQIELRILAHITGDDTLVEAFKAHEDVHARTAADLFDVPVDKVDSEMRRKAKMTNYAIAYGVSGFGLAKQLGTGSAGEAAEFIKRYFEALPGVKNYIDDILQTARRDGYVQTLMGRRRPLPDIHSPRAQERAAADRTAINHPIQGTAADMMKLAMLAIHKEMGKRKVKSKMTMQVHDELVFEVPNEELDMMADLVTKAMREVPARELKLRVPLEVDAEAGLNWDEAEAL